MTTKSENVSKAIMNKFGFTVTNNTTSSKRLAIIPSYLNRLGITLTGSVSDAEFVSDVDFAGESVTKKSALTSVINATAVLHHHDTTALNAAGYPVDVILDDATVDFIEEDKSTKTFAMAALNSTKKIIDFLEYIKTNPINVKNLTIISSDKTAFSADQEVAKLNPFTREKEVLIDNNMFYNKFQVAEDRIEVQFDNELELSDVLLWVMTVPAGAKMDIILRF